MAELLPYHAVQAVSNLDLNRTIPWEMLMRHRFLNAHETTAVENFAIALLCGEVRIDVSSLLLWPPLYLDLADSRFSTDVLGRPHP